MCSAVKIGSTRSRTRNILALTILVIGLFPVLSALIRNVFCRREISVPIKLLAGEHSSTEFTTTLENGRYLLALQLERLSDIKQEVCELGVAFAEDCFGIKQTVDFDWQVTSIMDGSTVAAGRYAILYYGGIEDVGFGEFRAKRGSRYRLFLLIHRDAGPLNQANPELVVKPGGEYSENEPYLYGLLWFWAILASSVGIWVYRHG
jgi:hypothetical protein